MISGKKSYVEIFG